MEHKQWITPDGKYHVGDKLYSCNTEVYASPPPSREQETEAAKGELSMLDAQCVRPLRAVIVAMIEGREPGAEDEKLLVEIEKRAVAERAKVKLEA